MVQWVFGNTLLESVETFIQPIKTEYPKSQCTLLNTAGDGQVDCCPYRAYTQQGENW